ncbi:hypothetical protein BLNAU_22466 [Blattamonas nauphoetae]|uniref:Transposase n=1 Tax=Blattamonas nauphoetae TaxID=2049346 RepID=A0ABQ9WKA3_9EUKA|nr:hypothetical protein BLNAU_25193 [Blattamonas nauphoetae]KAK2942615.1 hypothetical protein BLNAU_22466 [Blattamonas nauphoetae]
MYGRYKATILVHGEEMARTKLAGKWHVETIGREWDCVQDRYRSVQRSGVRVQKSKKLSQQDRRRADQSNRVPSKNGSTSEKGDARTSNPSGCVGSEERQC